MSTILHPCGQVCGYIRRGYRTRAILVPGAPPVWIRWFFADPGAKLAPQPNWVLPKIWDDHKVIGEVSFGDLPTRRPPWDDGSNPLALTGRTFCGSLQAWHRAGEPGFAATVMVTDKNGLLPCCHTANMPGVGGLGVGGTGYPAGPYAGILRARATSSPNQAPAWRGAKSLVSSMSRVVTQIVSFTGGKTLLVPDEDVMTGDLKLNVSNSPPAGWHLCNGQLLAQATYPALYGLLGAAFGPDVGGMFTLPDMTGRTAVQPDATGVWLPIDKPALGHAFGAQDLLLSPGQSGLVAHTHGWSAGLGYAIVGAGAGDGLTAAGVAVPCGTADILPAAATGAVDPIDMCQPSVALGYWWIKD